jgi:hypothetical protein
MLIYILTSLVSFKVYNSGCSGWTGIGLPVLLVIGAAGADPKGLAAAGADSNVVEAVGALKLAFNPPKLAEAEKPLLGNGEGLPLLGGGADLLAASNALALKSLSPPANIIPDNVPVKNVAIGMINSKNF